MFEDSASFFFLNNCMVSIKAKHAVKEKQTVSAVGLVGGDLSE